MTAPTHWYPTAARILTTRSPDQPTPTTRHRPPVLAWHHAAVKRPCPQCGDLIRPGHRVAHVNLDHIPAHVCERCTK